MKTAHVIALVAVVAAGAFVVFKMRKGATVANVKPGGAFVGPPAPAAASGVIGSKPNAAFVGPLPFVGPPSPSEVVAVDTSWLEYPQSAPM